MSKTPGKRNPGAPHDKPGHGSTKAERPTGAKNTGHPKQPPPLKK